MFANFSDQFVFNELFDDIERAVTFVLHQTSRVTAAVSDEDEDTNVCFYL